MAKMKRVHNQPGDALVSFVLHFLFDDFPGGNKMEVDLKS